MRATFPQPGSLPEVQPAGGQTLILDLRMKQTLGVSTRRRRNPLQRASLLDNGSHLVKPNSPFPIPKVHSPHGHQSAGGATGRLCHSEWGIRKTGLNGLRIAAERISIRVHSRDSWAKKIRPANHANRCECREHRRDHRSATNLLRLCAHQNRSWKITANVVAVSRPPESASLLQQTPPFCRQHVSVGNTSL